MADDVIVFRSPFCVGGIHKASPDTSLFDLTALHLLGFELDRVPSDASPQLLAALERAGFRLDVPHVDAEPYNAAIDEIHVSQNRDVWNALDAAPVKRGCPEGHLGPIGVDGELVPVKRGPGRPRKSG